MNKLKFEIILGAVCAVMFIAFCIWETPQIMGGKLSKTEIDGYLSAVDKQLNVEGKKEILSSIRVWAEADDGKPVYMLNLMRNYPELNRYPGSPDFKGTPEESNRYYESKTIPLIAKTGTYPIFSGAPQGKCVVGPDPNVDSLSRVLVVRYTNRRAFLSLLSDPAYAAIAPYKFMALHVSLLPMTSEMVVPDMRFMFGSTLLALFLAVGWIRSARRNKPVQQD